MNRTDAIVIASAYPTARGFYERVRWAAGMTRHIERQIAEGIERRGAGNGPKPLVSDPTAAAAMRDEAEAELLAELAGRLQECRDLVEAGAFVAYGVQYGLGETYADALIGYYIQRLQWPEVARRQGVGLTTVQARRDAACEWVDSVGWRNAVWGKGRAE